MDLLNRSNLSATPPTPTVDIGTFRPYQAHELFAMCFYLFCVVICVPLNLLLIYLSITRPDLRKPHNFMILNLLISELILMLLYGTAHPYYVFARPGHELPCAVIGFITYTLGMEAFMNYPLISIQRYYAMFHSAVAVDLFCPRRVALMIAGLWITGALLEVPSAVTNGFGFEELQLCGQKVEKTPWKIVWMLLEVNVVTMVGYAICVYCNLKISQELRKHSNHVSNRGLTSKVVSEFESVQRMIFVNCVLPVIFQFPAVVSKIVPDTGDNPWIGRAFIAMYLVVPTANPYVMIFCMKPYRDEVVKVLSGCFSRFSSRAAKIIPASDGVGNKSAEQMSSLKLSAVEVIPVNSSHT